MDLPSETELRLLALVVTERSGREVAQAFERETGREISFGTLYVTFRRLKEAGWITVRDDRNADGRVRWFRITGAGSTAMQRAREHHRHLAQFGLGGQPA